MLGVIGGMGPLATSLFYDMVTEKTCAKCDQDNINMLILSDAAMPDRTAAILSGDTETVRQRMLADARFLEKNGCEAIAVTCNTAHYFVDMIEEEVGIPFIHMIRETAKALSEQFAGKRVAVLATDGTIQTGLYQKALEQQNVKAYAPERNIQAAVMETIYGRIKQNKPADPELWQRIETACRGAGCDGALLACTELSVVKKQLSLPESYYVDPMEVMAQRCVERFARA